jgi:hypothetical protein
MNHNQKLEKWQPISKITNIEHHSPYVESQTLTMATHENQ